jgi:hypothetical protein
VLAGGPFGSEVLSTSRARQWGVPIERRNGLIPAKTSQRDVKIGMAGCAEKPRGRGETGTLTKWIGAAPKWNSTGHYRYYVDRPIGRRGTVRGRAGAAPNTIGFTRQQERHKGVRRSDKT